ncbi:MAG: ABC transporter transmembrane domain-containing protein, partial [Leptolyngbyaceae bacterium]|nr:ABC transporter transmembrane domain-containing protein [Leptolyngbyaceae bacterium]
MRCQINHDPHVSAEAAISPTEPLAGGDLWKSLLAALDQICAPADSPASYTITEFGLGHELLVHPSPSTTDLWVVCRGQVRLLCYPAGESRETTAMLLEAGDTLGAEASFGLNLPAYRGIAMGSGAIARIPTTALALLLETVPSYRQVLGQLAVERERLLFFKTATELRSLPSRLLRSIQTWGERRMMPGTRLAAATPAAEGRFWLRQGEVRSQREDGVVPNLGSSWGYPDPTPDDWVAQTELIVYQLDPEAWDRLSALSSNRNARTVTGETSQPTTPRAIAPPRPLSAAAGMAPTTSPSQSTTAIAPAQSQSLTQPSPTVIFAKPKQRRLLDWLDRYPWVEQQSSSDCGAACLSMILRYWGKRVPVHVLRDRANVGRTGASLKNLAKAAEALNFHARPVKASLNRMVDQPNPWIAHWEGNHYVVVYRFRGNRAIIADPALGRRTLSSQEFQRRWTGYALLLDPTDQIDTLEAHQPSLGKYLKFLLSYRTLAFQIVLVSVLIQIFSVITPLFTQIILDRVVVQKSQSTLNVFALGLLLFGVWSVGMTGVRQYLLSYFSNRLDLTLISGFIRHTLTLPLKFFESRRVGDILTRVQENQKIQRFLVGQVVLAWLNFITAFIYLGLMFYYNWQLTLLVLALIPPIVLLTLGATPWLRRVSREVFNDSADQNSSLVEMITGVATVKAAAAEQDLRWRWEDHLTNQMNALFRGQKLGIGLQLGSGLINSIGNTALLWYGATLVIQGQLTIGQFVAFNMMIGYVINPVVSLSNLWDELQEVLISVERLDDVFEAKPEEPPGLALLGLPTLKGAVQFENVNFLYGDDEAHNTLQNLSFAVQPGQTIAIVGHSGSGKTTLVKLIQGLYFANSGRVFIDGHDLRHVSLQSLRSQMGVVPQECFLFSGTIRENITLHR